MFTSSKVVDEGVALRDEPQHLGHEPQVQGQCARNEYSTNLMNFVALLNKVFAIDAGPPASRNEFSNQAFDSGRFSFQGLNKLNLMIGKTSATYQRR